MRWGERCAVRRWLVGMVVVCYAAPGHCHLDPAQRIQEYSAKITESKSDPQLLLRRAKLHIEQAEFAAAKADLLQVLRHAPQANAAHFHLAQVYQASQQWPAARQAAQQFVAHADSAAERARGYQLLGDIAMAEKDYLRALGHYRKKLAVQQKPIPQDYLLAARAAQLSEGSDAALTLLDEGLRKLGPVSALQQEAFALERGQGNYTAALARVAQMLAVAHGYRVAVLLEQQAQILLALRRVGHAQASLQRALAQIQALPAHRRALRPVRDLQAQILTALAAH